MKFNRFPKMLALQDGRTGNSSQHVHLTVKRTISIPTGKTYFPNITDQLNDRKQYTIARPNTLSPADHGHPPFATADDAIAPRWRR